MPGGRGAFPRPHDLRSRRPAARTDARGSLHHNLRLFLQKPAPQLTVNVMVTSARANQQTKKRKEAFTRIPGVWGINPPSECLRRTAEGRPIRG